MSLTTPILNSVPAWDVSMGQLFTFNVIGGDQVVGSTLYIKNNATGIVEYTQDTVSYQYQIQVPANPSNLVNGTYYSAYIVTKNNSNQISQPSNFIQFYCYTTPTFNINIAQGAVITNSAVNTTLSYTQIENEPLNDYTFFLYNSSRSQISSSGMQYTDNDTGTFTTNYSFLGLTDGDSYFIRVEGHTVEGTVLDTGYIRFTVQYSQPQSYNILSLKNNCKEGYIDYYSNAFSIVGIGYNAVLSDDMLKLNGNIDSYAIWDDGVRITDNFALSLWFTNLKLTVNNDLFGQCNMVTLMNDDTEEQIAINYVCDYVEQVSYVEAVVNDSYYIYSNFVPIDIADKYFLRLQRIDNLYILSLVKGVNW